MMSGHSDSKGEGFNFELGRRRDLKRGCIERYSEASRYIGARYQRVPRCSPSVGTYVFSDQVCVTVHPKL